MPNFVDVILPLPLEKKFTYAVTDSQAGRLKPGMRVAVPFGKTKVYTGAVANIHQERPKFYKAKPVEEIMDEHPLLTRDQLQFFKWIAGYYMCGEGEVLRAALPSAFLLQSETVIELNQDTDHETIEMTDEEYLIVEALQSQSLLKTREVMEILDKKTVLPVLDKMVEKQLIVVNQELYKKYKPKQIRYVRLAGAYKTDENLNALLEELSRAPKQRQALMTLFSLQAKSKKPLQRKTLQNESGVSSTTLKTLIDKGILEEYNLKRDRVSYEDKENNLQLTLTEGQERAHAHICEVFKADKPCLLHGVTSSGKTEIYIRLIQETLDKGEQVLYLVPEIALTTQLILRLQRYFGKEVMVYHSKYSVNERVEIYNHVLQNDKGRIVIGVRSSIFLPFQDLGLIVVDEAHESTFKQFDPAPRYHARDAASILAAFFKCNLIMGSATPSLESYFNVKQGKYGLARLTKRFGEVIPPKIELVNIKDKHKRKKMTGHFSDTLIDAIKTTLDEAKQVILFQNRRGYSPILECQTCGHSPQCPNCDVSLTYHRHNNSLRCHYCGYHIAMQRQCMACGSTELSTKGLGTERVEKELNDLFPKHTTQRMDLDTTRGKHGYEKIINAFEQKDIDILIGTQMLAKGLDFRDVDLVGVMNADSLLNFPDFRAHERSFQLLSQVSGRAGRTDKQGEVLIQTYNPDHAILRHVIENDYQAMFDEQMQGRAQFKYPPLYRLIKISLKGKNYNTVNEAADWLAEGLRQTFKDRVLGPEFPPVARIRNQYYKVIMLKIPPKQSLHKTKAYLRKLLKSYHSVSQYRSVRVILNVDPY